METIISAEDMFGSVIPSATQIKPLSLGDMVALGMSISETDDAVMLEVPFIAQKKLVEYVKNVGFGASKVLDVLLRGMLTAAGMTGKVQFQINEKTFTWSAQMLKNSPKEEAGQPEPAAGIVAPPASISDEDQKVAHKSGANSSHFSPFSFFCPFEGVRLTCQRFLAGNRKYEAGTTVYAEMNWLKALASRDVAFFRDRAGHALEHLLYEMHGTEDSGPGGNLGAVGWWVETFAYVKSRDPFLYACIQGKHHITDAEAEKAYAVG